MVAFGVGVFVGIAVGKTAELAIGRVEVALGPGIVRVGSALQEMLAIMIAQKASITRQVKGSLRK